MYVEHTYYTPVAGNEELQPTAAAAAAVLLMLHPATAIHCRLHNCLILHSTLHARAALTVPAGTATTAIIHVTMPCASRYKSNRRVKTNKPQTLQ
jgi:hypothetical protein